MKEDLRIRAVAFSITARFEGGSYQTCQIDDAGILSYGRFQFTLASGVLGRIVEHYTENSSSQIAASLGEYRSRIASRDAQLRHEPRLHDLLAAAGREPEMRQIQDDEARSNYWEPTRRIAVVPRHLKTPLAQALLFDISINFGLGDGFLRIAEREFGVAERSRVDQNGIGEAQLITRVAELRKLSHDRQASRDNLPGLRARGEFWLNLVRAGDWQLHGDAKGEIVVKNRPLQVRAPDLSHGDSQPGLDPDRFYVSPTENRVRIREQPETGITLAMTGFGDLLESLEPHAATRAKIGSEHAWLHVRSLDGFEGHIACMFLAVHQDPDPQDMLPPSPPQPARPGYMAPFAVSPVTPLLVTPVEDRIRVRALPVDGEMLDSISRGDVAEVLEGRDAALAKVGVQDEWLRLRSPGGTEGYSAAWFLEVLEDESAQQPEPAAPSAPTLSLPIPVPPTPAAPTPRSPLRMPGIVATAQLFVSPTVELVRVRAQPLDGEQIAVLSQNDVALVLEDAEAALGKVGVEGEWLRIRTPEGVEGYCAAQLFGVFDGSRPTAPGTTGQGPGVSPDAPVYVTPTEDRVQVRDQPGEEGEPIGTLSQGDVVEVIKERATALEKIGMQDEWLQIRTPSGAEGYTAAWYYVIAETPEQPRLYITPANERVRIRSAPMDGDPLAIVRPGDVLTVLDPYREAQTRVGHDGEWLYVRSREAVEGYTNAGHYLIVAEPEPIIGDNITGVNLDRYHRLGTPNPGRLGNIGWVRFNYNVSLNPALPPGQPERYGNRDIDTSYARYSPVINAYINAGLRVVLVLAHQTYGEATGDSWHRMDSRRWRLLSDQLAEMAGQIAAQYSGKGIVWQIWNEMDAHTGARASVPLPAQDYGSMLGKCITAIRESDPDALVITGGHASGPLSGPDYARQALEAMPRDLRPDGIAFHPYGRGPAFAAGKYRHFGLIDEALDAWAQVLPGKPLWITEFGVLNAEDEPAEEIAKYASDFIGYLKQRYEGRVVTVMWFAWGSGMDNGFGLVDSSDMPLAGLTDVYIAL